MTREEMFESLRRISQEVTALWDALMEEKENTLQEKPAPASSQWDAATFFGIFRKRFGKLKQEQVDALNWFVPRLLDTNLPINHMAYILATAYHETAGTMHPIVEYGSDDYIEKLYDPVNGSTASRRKRAKAMGNTEPGDGWRYRGRGYVQLTWKNNYKTAQDKLGVSLVDHPELALDKAVAFQILVDGMVEGWFTGRKLGDFTTYAQMRKVVNGTDKASLIAGYASHFEEMLKASTPHGVLQSRAIP